MAKEYEKCMIHSVNYKNTSTMGNPSYWISFSDEEGNLQLGYTAINAMAGYDAANLKYQKQPHAYLKYHFTKNGNCIIDYIRYDV